jgi:hypothetical protein
LSSALLIFSDGDYFVRSEKKKEARFAIVAGIFLAVMGIALFIVSNIINIA